VTLSVREWLPDQEGLPRAGEHALAEAVDAWAAEWFAGEAIRALGVLAPVSASRGELRRTEWHRCREGLALGLPPRAEAGLGSLALDVTVGGERTVADLAVLEGVACLEALKARLAALLGLPRSERWSEGAIPPGGWRIDLGTPTRTLTLALEVSQDLLVRLIKAKLPESAPSPLGDPVGALAGLPLRIAATAGECMITVAELSGLSPGDVIVLNRDLDAGLPLLIEGRALRRGSCVLAEQGGTAALRIVQAPIG